MRQTLKDIIRNRSGCSHTTKIVMYNSDLKVIHWDDWEDMVEANQWYMADLDDRWVLHLMSKGGSSPAIKSVFATFIQGTDEATPTAPRVSTPSTITPRPAELPLKPSPRDVGPSTPTPKSQSQLGTSDAVPLPVSKSVSMMPQLAEMSGESIVQDPLVKDLERRVRGADSHGKNTKAIYGSSEEEYANTQPKSARRKIPPPVSLRGREVTSSPISVAQGTPFQKHLPPPPPLPPQGGDKSGFVPSTESFDKIQENLLNSTYTKQTSPANDPPQSPPRSAATSLALADILNTPNTRTNAGPKKDKSKSAKLIFKVILPSARKKPIPEDESSNTLVKVPGKLTPVDLIKKLGKNPDYTTLVVLEPSQNRKRYFPVEVIMPGTPVSTTTFADLGWPSMTRISWEHIDNDEEKERKTASEFRGDESEVSDEDDDA
ncbi:hypothetical protein ABW19_dt0204506 [Dactylella cylindrospora]|nr:hypothetical protein ABW19_dt0204506 [Dactylella cylindrospora]